MSKNPAMMAGFFRMVRDKGIGHKFFASQSRATPSREPAARSGLRFPSPRYKINRRHLTVPAHYFGAG